MRSKVVMLVTGLMFLALPSPAEDILSLAAPNMQRIPRKNPLRVE